MDQWVDSGSVPSPEASHPENLLRELFPVASDANQRHEGIQNRAQEERTVDESGHCNRDQIGPESEDCLQNRSWHDAGERQSEQPTGHAHQILRFGQCSLRFSCHCHLLADLLKKNRDKRMRDLEILKICILFDVMPIINSINFFKNYDSQVLL